MAGAVASPPAHRVLRESTRAAHEAAEETAGMRRLMAGELDAGGYAALLRAQLRLFREWEAGHGGWLASLAGWRYVSRAGLLAGDISVAAPFAHDVGSHKEPHHDTTPPVGAHEAGDPAHDAAAWGELYVIEGSALGGRIIVRRLRELYPRLSHRFYAVGEEAPSGWRRFQGLLDTALADPAALATAVDAARAMFSRFQHTLADPAAHD